ncbi:MAG: Fe-S cluster assembly ATPase SufC [Alphaproteobacteria bacterium]|nr:Fe-S cluster assembly ATPase SufC [Alphaproteobacteria bacterium]
MTTPLLEIEDLYATVDGKEIIKGFNLTINEGEVHAIMGPNGAGKSTLSYILCGKDGYEVTSGSIKFKGQDLLSLNVEERARAGLFLIMQHPVEIPGVSVSTFLKHSLNDIRKANDLPLIDTMDFIKTIKDEAKSLSLTNDMLKRSVNVGFSGGEKKRMEALQMALLKPDMAILDEADSGLDIDALKTVAEKITSLKDKKRSMLIITHFQRLLNYIEPDFVHIFANGHIVKSGNKELAVELEQNGYADFIRNDA